MRRLFSSSKRLEPFGIGHVHADELGFPLVIEGIRKAVPAAHLLDRHAGVGFLQEANNLFFGKSLLHFRSLSETESTTLCSHSWGQVKSTLREPL